MTTPPRYVSVTLPVSQAIERVKRVLFQPFDPGKWFTIGFCAWLATLGQHGGGGSGGGNFKNSQWHGWNGAHESLNQARAWIGHNFYWLLPLVIVVVALGLALWVLLVWVSSRGKFMFLNCVALDKAEVVAPWQRFAREANSLFWFRLALGLCGMLLILPLIAGAVVVALGMVEQEAATASVVLGLLGLGFGMLLVGCALWIVSNLTTEFVVPVLFLRGGGCLAAWRALLGLIAGNIGHFILYLLFRFVLGLGIGLATLAIILMTCCVAGCLLAIPYLGTVLFLPVLVFVRSYSACYLAQYGPEWDVFAAAAGPTGP
jgi:hypothetical protein